MKSHLARVSAIVLAVAMVPAATSAISQVESDTQREISRFIDIFERVKADYVEPVNDDKLMRGAIDGMLASLDPHSSYLDARDFENLRTQTEGVYGGLGLSVTMQDGAVKVIAPTRETPADLAGIKAGDYITHLDGKLIYGGTLDDAVDQMRGAPGTSIKLTIVREGRDKPFDVNITRGIIDLKPVTWEIKDDIGLITIASFTSSVGEDVTNAVLAIDKKLGKKPLGYVLDMRSNPGGLLDEAVAVTDVFLEKGEIVSQRGRRKGDIERYYARPGDVTDGLPVIVLVDSGSASASEIVAGALQDHRRALVMGERSFGKGSVQTLLPLSRTSALKLTTARYFTPSGKSVQEGGIEPDIQVPQLSDPDYKTRMKLRESDLRGHLINEIGLDDKELEKDKLDDPRFTMTTDQLKEKGIEDFQLYYAMATLKRTTLASARLAATGARAPRPVTAGRN
ncbi:S41 family peptidase [Blastomonas sp.]|uniref:S41 family peptidase n=1 Tax=Blastomonas sp. TaxID=1909299 RepID=UPI003592F6A7